MCRGLGAAAVEVERARFAAAFGVGVGFAATCVVALTALADATALSGVRFAAARFGGADRLAVFLTILARLFATRVGFADVRFARLVFLPAFLVAVPAERRLVAREALRFGRLAARLAVGRFRAFLAMSV